MIVLSFVYVYLFIVCVSVKLGLDMSSVLRACVASDAGKEDVGSSESVRRCFILRSCDAKYTVGETVSVDIASCYVLLLEVSAESIVVNLSL